MRPLTTAVERDNGLVPLAPASLPELIANRIIEAVGRGQLQPCQHLIETELSDQLSVSRIPLREALRVLQSQGIVVAMPRRGVRLIAFDVDWARELLDARVALERLASQAAAVQLRSDAGARAQLAVSLRNLEIAAAGDDLFMVNASELALHSTIFEISARPLLMTLWAALVRHVMVSFFLSRNERFEPRRILARHRALRSVLLRGSEAEIDAEIARHGVDWREAGNPPPLPKVPRNGGFRPPRSAGMPTR